uniref:Surface-adhesin protein E-like domain-containing protein n=3 Tax=root TaxID=1 RepID=A0A6M3XET9_9ZZZZ
MFEAVFGAAAFALGATQDGYQPPWPADDGLEASIAWQVEHLDIAPAAIVWLDETMVAVMRRETLQRTGNTARAWFHWEALNADQAQAWGGRSMLLLREMDCEQRRTRIIAASSYSGTNLTGRHTDHNSSPSEREWVYDRPGMLGAAQTAAACDGQFFLRDLLAD